MGFWDALTKPILLITIIIVIVLLLSGGALANIPWWIILGIILFLVYLFSRK